MNFASPSPWYLFYVYSSKTPRKQSSWTALSYACGNSDALRSLRKKAHLLTTHLASASVGSGIALKSWRKTERGFIDIPRWWCRRSMDFIACETIVQRSSSYLSFVFIVHPIWSQTQATAYSRTDVSRTTLAYIVSPTTQFVNAGRTMSHSHQHLLPIRGDTECEVCHEPKLSNCH